MIEDLEGWGQWFRMYELGCRKIALKGLHGRDYDVFFVMLSFLSKYSNIVAVTHIKIAEVLGIPRQSVSRSIKRLVKESLFIVIESTDKSNSLYRLNAAYAFKGKFSERVVKFE